MARTAASAAWSVVMQGMPCETAAARIRPSSVRGTLAAGRVHDQAQVAVEDVVQDVGMPLRKLHQPLHANAGRLDLLRRAPRGQKLEAELLQPPGQLDGVVLRSARPR